MEVSVVLCCYKICWKQYTQIWILCSPTPLEHSTVKIKQKMAHFNGLVKVLIDSGPCMGASATLLYSYNKNDKQGLQDNAGTSHPVDCQ